MRLLTTTVLIIVTLVLKISLGPFLSIKGASPDLVLLLGLGMAMRLGAGSGFRVGFAGGLLEDLLFSRFVGMNAMAKGLVAYLAGLAGMKVFRDSLPVLLLVGFAASLVCQVLVLVVLAIAGYGIVPSISVLSILGARALYDALLFPIFYRGLKPLKPVSTDSGGNGLMPGV